MSITASRTSGQDICAGETFKSCITVVLQKTIQSGLKLLFHDPTTSPTAVRGFSAATICQIKAEWREWASRKKNTIWSSSYGALVQSFSHQIDSCHVNIEHFISEHTGRDELEKQTDALLRGTLKKEIGHFVKSMQQSTWQPCNTRTRNCQIQMAFQKGGRKGRRYRK